MKLNYHKFDFKESEKWLRIARRISGFFFKKLVRGSEVRAILASRGCISILEFSSLHVGCATHTSCSNLFREGCFGSLPTHVGILPEEPSCGICGIVTLCLDTLYHILQI